MEYLVANLLGMVSLSIFWYLRSDLIRKSILIGLITAPLALLDLFFVPEYWIPQTLFSIPVGFEGFIYSFQIGALASIVYKVFFNKSTITIKGYRTPIKEILFFGFTFLLVLFLHISFSLNLTLGLYIVAAIGISLIILKRPDLGRSILYSGIIYGIIYFLSIAVWSALFPETRSWFVLTGLPKIFILNVPLTEICFGILQGAFLGNLYEFVFGYKHS